MRDEELVKIAGGTATMDNVITTFAGLQAIATEAARQERERLVEAVANAGVKANNTIFLKCTQEQQEAAETMLDVVTSAIRGGA